MSSETHDVVINRATDVFPPLGWPAQDAIEKMFNTGIGDDGVTWTFDLVMKSLPPGRIIREMYGIWRYKNNGPTINPYNIIPTIETEGRPVAVILKQWPGAEFFVPLRAYVVEAKDVYQLTITTVRLTAVINPIFQASFFKSKGESALAESLREFQRGLGV